MYKENTVISKNQYKIAASLLNCEIPAIQAIAGVESAGSGFLSDGRIKILFEPHVFWQQLKLAKIDFVSFAKKNPDIIYQHQGEKPYGTFAEQYDRLSRARNLNLECANKSCSWGKFQPLGLYHLECGFDSVAAMITRYTMNEYEHLMGFVRMIKYRKLDVALRNKDWTTFAKAYNGAGYKGKPGIQDDYDYKIMMLYKKLVS